MIENTTLYNEIRAVFESGPKAVFSDIRAQIRVTDTNEVIEVMKIISIDRVSDYELAFCDDIRIRIMVSGGVYASQIYPKQDRLEIDITYMGLSESSTSFSNNSTRSIKTFVAALYDRGNADLQQKGMAPLNSAVMDITNLIELDFQLIPKAMDQLRMAAFGGVFRQTSVTDIIRTVLTAESDKLKLAPKDKILGVNIIPADNQVVRDQVVIPQGTRVVDIPGYIQNRCGGVYSAGMGYYLDNNYWYIYPCYNLKRFASAERVVTIINVPEDRFPQIERTFRVDGSNVVILATGQIKLTDNSESRERTAGNGIRFSNSNMFMEGFIEKQGNKAVTNRAAVNNEFAFKDRVDTNNFIPVSADPIHSNVFFESSKLAARDGGVISLVWENSNPLLIKPDTMVNLMYMSNNKLKQVKGIVLKSHHYTMMEGQGITNNRYITKSTLSIFVSNR